jgi:hypothetical protein
MPEIRNTFDQLYAMYTAEFPPTTHIGATRTGLRGTMQEGVPNRPGVYVIYERTSDIPIYIGSAGKIGRNLVASGSTMRTRIFQSTTPYHFDNDEDLFRYGPRDADVPPVGYASDFPIANIRIECLVVPHPLAPSVLEHLLIQGFINQYHDLPLVNREI